jgi:hypothetical protein
VFGLNASRARCDPAKERIHLAAWKPRHGGLLRPPAETIFNGASDGNQSFYAAGALTEGLARSFAFAAGTVFRRFRLARRWQRTPSQFSRREQRFDRQWHGAGQLWQRNNAIAYPTAPRTPGLANLCHDAACVGYFLGSVDAYVSRLRQRARNGT